MARPNDLEIYERHAREWWDPRSPWFRSLHSINEFRVALLREWLGDRLDGLVVVDLGCGGGLLAEPMARSGARVIGIDLSRGSLLAATERVEGCFVHADLLRTPLAGSVADIVLMADVLEHLHSVRAALLEAARVLRPGGILYVNTINRTPRARWLAVFLAEAVGLVPRGTHDPKLFVPPGELCQAAKELGLEVSHMQGERANLSSTIRRWSIALEKSDDLSVGYSVLFRKGGGAQRLSSLPRFKG